jgi:hypothetical protein
MKIRTLLSYLFFLYLQLIFFSIAYAESDYKCYAIAADGKDYLVVQFANSLEEAKTLAYTKKVYNKQWNKEFIVKYIPECAKVSESFTKPDAIKLDSQIDM